jgi:serine/threonine-protein kinase
MTLQPGIRLGPYEVLSALGAGGMGEVYRARDTRLGREVAIKVLPEAFAADAERVARFQREAQVLASLNHSNIAAIYGLEDGPAEAGPHARALVLELVEGPTLADRIAQRPLPLDEALPIAKQIAEALEAAHEHGIVHRDLKPANIKLRADGTVKVLDFGLAKLTDPAHAPASDLSLSPTITSPAMMTGVGMILGTAAYMAPEQAKGRPADKRSDVWAFGCVLYEMLTGKRAFDGEDMTDVIAAIVRGEPDWTAVPSAVPVSIRGLIKGCLEKDRKRRIADISVARFLLNEPAEIPAESPALVAPPVRRGRTVAAAMLGLGVGAAVATLVVWLVMRPAPGRVSRFEIVPPQAEPFATPGGVNVAISPDGSTIVYHAQPGGTEHLVVRRTNELAAKPISGTERATNPFFSPDGSRIGFVSGAQLKTIGLAGGPPAVVCDVTGQVQGASWAADVIVFAQAGSGLFRVPAAGGRPENVAAPDAKKGESDYRWPEVLPDGKTILYTIYGSGGTRQARIAGRRLDGTDTKILVEGGNNAHYVPSGHLVYATVPSTVMAVPFDLKRLEVTGAAIPVQEGIVAKGDGVANFTIADDGTLVYVRGGGSVFQTGLGFQWIGRDGKPNGAVATQVEGPRYPRLSPDGRRLAVTLGPSNQGNIWVIDLTGAAQPLELTFKNHNVMPIWRPDGKYLVFNSDRNGQRNLYGIPADGSALEPDRLSTSANHQQPEAWSPDGQWILFRETAPKTRFDLMLLGISGDKKPRPWLQTEFDEDEASFSPDGRWVSYVSDQTGRAEVWVRPFPGPGAPVRVSPDGGREPLWSRNGAELFYQSGRKLMTAELASKEPELRFKMPRVLFEGGFVPYEANVGRTYDVAPDGRFLMIQEDQRLPSASLVVVQNWSEELKRLVPTLR